jgi:dihydrofolate synthase / folylpolyglutamate synthase
MDFESALQYLETLISHERDRDFLYDEKNFDLDQFREVVEDFGVDYSGLRIVHVAGSKGKGSVCNFISEYLVRTDESVGLFTSPHLQDIRERIRVGGEMISHKRFGEYVGMIADYMERSGKRITYFEVLTLVALKFFVDEGVEFVVLEVGLGGRLDSTNIVTPELSVLTAVEMEHVGILGDNLSEILDEKLGIIKEGVPLLVGEQSEEVMSLLKGKLERKVDVHYVDDFGAEFDGDDRGRVVNVRMAWCALKLLFGGVDESVFGEIFENYNTPGRFDVREFGEKVVVFDVAHTVESMKNLMRTVKARFPDKKYVFLVKFLKDKDKDGMLKVINEVAEKVYEEVEMDEIDLKRDQILVVTGSHSLVGEFLPVPTLRAPGN